MSEPATRVLLVDPDLRTRALVARHLSTIGCEILQAGDGAAALDIVSRTTVKVVVTELYLPAGGKDDLIEAIRADRTLRHTRAMAHTHRCLAADRDWAMHAGADAYLIKPTRAERLRYVVSRLATTRGPNAKVAPTSDGIIQRLDSLEHALDDIEGGKLAGINSIVFGREWWESLPKAQQSRFRQRARARRVNLRSDALMTSHFVELRGASRTDVGLSSERPESPYRR